MRRVRWSLGIAALAILLGASAQSEERQLAKEDAVALVKSAIALIQAQGTEKAYPQITDRSGKYVNGELYVVVQALDGKVLAHGADATLVGKDQIGTKDVDGREYVRERLDLARAQSSFWQNYQAVNPISKDVQPKETYCERASDTVICAGIYAPLAPPGGC